MDFIRNTLMQLNSQNNTLYNVIYNLFFLAKIKESEDDVAKEKYCTLEEFKEYINELGAKSENTNI